MNLVSEKRELRERAKIRRAELALSQQDFAERISEFASNVGIPAEASVGGYQALPDEADPTKLLTALGSRGCKIAYPRVHAKAQPLWFHIPVLDEPWLSGAYGVREPRPDWPRVFPSVFLVPLLAFDAEGYRLGYGGGYYDRTLAQARAERAVIAIGVAFKGQEVPSVPHDARDQPVDMMVTEGGVRRFPTA